MRRLSLHVWLGLALALVVAVPALAGVAAWGVVGRWQAGREDHRERQALAVLDGAPLLDADTRAVVVRRLAALGVEAQVGPSFDDAKVAKAYAVGTDKGLAVKPIVVTSGFENPDVKQRLAHYRESTVSLPGVGGQLWVPRESAAARWAVTLGVGLAALAAALAAVVLLLRRWVLQPLARLAADAERVAGGELDVEPMPTRAREVAQVGEALRGMAGGLRDALGSSAAAERERRFMVTAIAHDLRTPLFTLRGSLEALERGIGDGRYLDRAQDKAAHLDRLISDLFAFSRWEYAPDAIAFEDVDVGTLARRAAETVEPVAAARGCALDVRRPEPGLIVRGDADALLRVLTNLLDNATRHARRRVVLSACRENGTIRLEVADDGPGFTPDDLPHVFEPLFRSDRARATATGGTGLGLAIARRLAHAHGGEVEAANDPAGGARTALTLPLARVPATVRER
jgi:signal transduction histidine kinase